MPLLYHKRYFFQCFFTAINKQLTAENTTAGISNVPFRFGVDDDGNYGYILTDESTGADAVIPFKKGGEPINPTFQFSSPFLCHTMGTAIMNAIYCKGYSKAYGYQRSVESGYADLVFLSQDGAEISRFRISKDNQFHATDVPNNAYYMGIAGDTSGRLIGYALN